MLVYGVLLVAGLVGAGVVYSVLVHLVPGMTVNRADTMKTALLVIGGAGALAGLYVAYRKQRTDEANHVRDQDKLFTERYTAAAAQLGHDKPAVRLAGVYALARIADDSERDRPTCLEVLCAYLRMPYDPDSSNTGPAERQVRTAAQTAIGRRLRLDHPGFWPDARIDLTGAHLIDLDFSGVIVREITADGATFSGNTWFDKARFGGVAGFSDARFAGFAGFGGASFSGNAWFNKATFSWDAGFDKARFSRNAVFEKAIFSRNAGFDMATFSENARFNEATFSRSAWFFEARFGGAAVFGEATFSENAVFDKATFSRNAVFDKAIFSGNAGFNMATFNGDVWFGGATFNQDARFSQAAFNQSARFEKATFSWKAWFGGATFSEVVRFDGAQFPHKHPPVWPDGFAEPTEIVYVDPPAADPDPDPDPPAGPAVPPTTEFPPVVRRG